MAAPTVAAASNSARAAVAATTPTAPATVQGEDPSTYLEDALDWIQAHALRRDRVDWPATRAEARALASGARATADTYLAIRLALGRLEDRHSSLLDPDQAAEAQHDAGDEDPEARRLGGGIGYLEVPAFGGVDPALMAAFATRLQELIRAIDQPPACGWIVDLRQDEGGNLWPMLAGVGPLLGEGEVGAFVTSGQRVPWVYRDGGAYVGTQVVTVVNNPYRRADPPPVAVLTAAQTASSGELLVVAFRGRPSTRSFGSPTRGVPTSNEPKVLADGAVLLLTTAASADRTGATYEDTIQPDQRVAGVTLTRGDEATDPTVQAAATWLRAQPGCVPAA